MKSYSYSGITVILLLIILIWVTFNIAKWDRKDRVIADDVKSYYAYIPAAFIYKDLTLSFRNEKPEFINWFWPKVAPNGSLVIITSMGLSILYSPFFFVAHFYTLIVSPEMANGYSINYSFMLVMSTVFYVFLGLIYLRKFLLKYYSDITAAFVLIAVFLGTNLFFYATTGSVMSHGYSFALIAIFLYYTYEWYNIPSIKSSILLGITGGMVALIRPTNIIIGLLFFLWNINSGKDFAERLILLRNKYGKLLIMVFFSILVWIPQLIYWKFLTGQWLYFSYGSSVGFFFKNPQIFNVLFSFRNGLFVYTPIMFVALAGMIIMMRQRKNFMSIMLFSVVNVYVISSWWCWWYGGAFGARAFVDSYAIYSLPLGIIFERTTSFRKYLRIILYCFYSILILLNLFFTYKYRCGSIHYDSMTKEAFFDSFWRCHPSATFYDKLELPDYQKAEKGIYETVRKK